MRIALKERNIIDQNEEGYTFPSSSMLILSFSTNIEQNYQYENQLPDKLRM